MDRRRPPVAWSYVLPVAAAELLLLVATANRYGYHRDELYFRVAARHPAWGYDDQPALTPLIGRFSEWAFGGDPRGLSPNAHSERRPSSGVSGGWSSYPHAGCRAATRKYSSSRW